MAFAAKAEYRKLGEGFVVEYDYGSVRTEIPSIIPHDEGLDISMFAYGHNVCVVLALKPGPTLRAMRLASDGLGPEHLSGNACRKSLHPIITPNGQLEGRDFRSVPLQAEVRHKHQPAPRIHPSNLT